MNFSSKINMINTINLEVNKINKISIVKTKSYYPVNSYSNTIFDLILLQKTLLEHNILVY